MVHICALTSFSEGSCSTLLPFRSGAMFLTFHFIVHLRCFLKVAILHYFPSRVWLDAAVLRCCLFPVHFSHSATSIELGWSWCNLASDIKFLFTTDASLQARNSPAAQTAVLATLRILVHYKILCRPLSCTTSLPEWGCACYAAFLCSLTVFFVGRCLAPLPFRSEAVLVTLRILVHYKILCRPLSCTTSLPEWGCAFYAAFLCSFTVFFVGRCLAPLPFRSGAVFVALRILVHYEIFCRQLFYTTSLPEFRLMPVVGATAYFRNHGSRR